MTDSRAVLDRPAPPPDATVRYGAGPEQVADLRAGGEEQRPLLIVVHGGFWRAAWDRTHTGPLAADLAARGYPVAQVEYRRTGQPGGGWPGTFDDLTAAVAALPALAQAAGLRVAPGPPVLLGHSAGGHLALWYAQSGAPAPRAVLALAPVADLETAYQMDLDEGAVAALLDGGPQERPERYRRADPMLLPAPNCPVTVVHGDADAQVPVELSRRYAARTARARLAELPGVNHFAVIDPESSAWPVVTSELHSLFR